MSKVITLAKISAFLTAIIAVIRFFILSDMQAESTYFFVRQVEYTLTWIILFLFFIILIDFTLYEGPRYVHLTKRRNMKIVSYLAALACLLKTVMVITSLFPLKLGNAWLLAYNIAEVFVWAALTVFFAFFSTFCKSVMSYIEKKRYDEW